MAAPSVLHGCPRPLPCSSGPGSSDPSAPVAQLLSLALGGTLTFVPVGWSQRHSPPPRTWKFLGEHHHPLCHQRSGRCALSPGPGQFLSLSLLLLLSSEGRALSQLPSLAW